MRFPPVDRLRTLHGQSTSAWVGNGLHVVRESHWLALSGARHVDFNLALCHGEEGGAFVRECLDEVLRTRSPGIIALAGEAQGESQELATAGWRPVGSAPFMAVTTANFRPDAAARRLETDELPLAQALVSETYGLSPEIAEVALSVDATREPNRTVWGLFENDRVVSSLIAMQVEDSVVIWSMATSPGERRRGYGSRLLRSALHGSRETGSEFGLLHASAQGEALYLSAGYEILERWQFWSRPRWILPLE